MAKTDIRNLILSIEKSIRLTTRRRNLILQGIAWGVLEPKAYAEVLMSLNKCLVANTELLLNLRLHYGKNSPKIVKEMDSIPYVN